MTTQRNPRPKPSEPGAPLPTRGRNGRPKNAEARWRRRKDARPQEILDAALSVFAEKGFAAARMDDIAVRARVSKGTIYLYFASKEAVFKALVQEMVGAAAGASCRARRRPSGRDLAIARRNLALPRTFLARQRPRGAAEDRHRRSRQFSRSRANLPRGDHRTRPRAVRRPHFGPASRVGNFAPFPPSTGRASALRPCCSPPSGAPPSRAAIASPYDYEGLIEAHIATLLRGLANPESAT